MSGNSVVVTDTPMHRADLFESGKHKLLSTLPVGVALALFALALVLPACGSETDRNHIVRGWDAFVLSWYALVLGASGVGSFLLSKLCFWCVGSVPWPLAGQVSILFAAGAANPAFVVSLVTVAVGASRTALSFAVLTIAGMVSAAWVVTLEHGSLVDPGVEPESYALMSGYYVWVSAGAVLAVGAIGQLFARLLAGWLEGAKIRRG